MSPVATSKDAHAYVRIKKSLQARIEANQLRPGDPVGSERDIAQEHNVSLMTARHALKELELAGLVVRRARVGTFVAPPKIEFNKLLGFSEMMASRGFTVFSRLLSARIVDDVDEVAARLALATGSKLVKIDRIRIANGCPHGRETAYLPAQRFSRILECSLDRRSLFGILEQEFGVTIAYADEEVDATLADNRTCALLGIEAPAALLRIRDVLYSGDGVPIACETALYRADQYRLLVRRFR